MKNRTKLWLLMLISAITSILLFSSLSLVMGKIGDRGYDLKSLNALSQEVLNTIATHQAFQIEDITPILDNAHSNHPDIRYEWISADGSTIYDTFGEKKTYDFEQLANRMLNMPQNLWGVDEPVTLTFSISQAHQPYYLLMSLSSDDMKNGQVYFFMRTFKALSTFMLPLIVALLIPYLLSLWFFSSMDKRINKLNHALGQLNLQSELTVLEDTKKDEIGQLTTHYNAMARRIQNQGEQIKQFDARRNLLLSNLSHDLRTPLTMILGYAETIRAGLYKDEKELQASAKVLLQRSRYIDKLLDQLLDITRQDEGNLELHVDLHNVSEMMRKVAADYLMFLEGQNFTVEVNIPDEDIQAWIDASLIERALRNLLDNAIRYGSEGHYLEVGLTEKYDALFMTVIDKGRGIPLQDQKHVFERFYRVDGSRKGEGLGIGLSIVQEIISLHDGSITFTSVPFERTVFEVQLPNHQREQSKS
ncbi:sensor histidine kinase [Paenibacillus chitinolyticus]|uniref:histidine kinase n=1 Tax=Paenibacillus chitinolyticus TaxID=79263 RepID=A0A410WY54_9BACL|nr:HAMP domain-containing sensor histidine kinase [Paenibacillus chitinolyticus]MCY9590653.1 HAMP domain-containing histidine kinase [Paenibacillus chitinolyticus]MCY9596351.1 HAMP domain-containing histidine kinase [Paenibacillus chitinolyticus]QAV19375.1 sensor histidine kinase [Paenibacillus chitinolyticus]